MMGYTKLVYVFGIGPPEDGDIIHCSIHCASKINRKIYSDKDMTMDNIE
jgi:hypothetical protein